MQINGPEIVSLLFVTRQFAVLLHEKVVIPVDLVIYSSLSYLTLDYAAVHITNLVCAYY